MLIRYLKNSLYKCDRYWLEHKCLVHRNTLRVFKGAPELGLCFTKTLSMEPCSVQCGQQTLHLKKYTLVYNGPLKTSLCRLAWIKNIRSPCLSSQDPRQVFKEIFYRMRLLELWQGCSVIRLLQGSQNLGDIKAILPCRKWPHWKVSSMPLSPINIPPQAPHYSGSTPSNLQVFLSMELETLAPRLSDQAK